MTNRPNVSVIMPVFNESIKDLKNSIHSILNQSYKNFEYIIIDDNPDNLQIKRFLKSIIHKDGRIRLVFNSHNLHLAKTENKAIKLANGRYIARIDGDDIAYPSRLKYQLKFLSKYGLDFTFSNFSLINDKSEITRKYTYRGKNEINQKVLRHLMTKSNFAIGPTFFFKKAVFNKLHGYRNMNCEDYDFVARALIKRINVGYQVNPLIYKRLRKNGISFDTLFNQYIIIHAISIYLKKFNYSKVIPISLLQRKINNVDLNSKLHFQRYANARYNYNDNKTIRNLLKIIICIFSSRIVFDRCLESLFNKLRIF